MTDDSLAKNRHSLAHIMATAVLELRPGSKLGFGPAIEDGFYYDFILSAPLSEEDFPELEKRMRKIIAQNIEFKREELPVPSALEKIAAMGEPYKQEYAEELIRQKGLQTLSFYTSGPFTDMCEGPHVGSTREIPPDCFRIKSLAGAYWRGDSRNVMMTRVYAWAFANRKELEAYVKAYELALERDHKKLGKELEIFIIDEEVGKGLPLWLPNGTVIRDELENLAKELEFKAGYKRVTTPHLTKVGLFYKTGHLPYYAKHMYPFMEVKEQIEKNGVMSEEVRETYALKPMNCPHHHRIFSSQMRSYRELPLRLAEYGDCYRFEDSGALSGLLRVRSMCMNDAHIYCTEDQIKSEFIGVVQLQQAAYQILGIEDYYFRLSMWDPEDPKGRDKYVDNPEAWKWCEQKVRETMIELGAQFKEVKGEAAFYGPKIDVQLKTVTGREESLSTTQLDFAVPPRLGMVFTGSDNKEYNPYVIHRAPLSTHERMVAFLIEHYGGAFPTWLAPVQAKIIPVGENFMEYGKKIERVLKEKMIRAELDSGADTLNKKIRTATKQKIPNILVIGEREQNDEAVTLRRYGIQEQKTMKVAEFVDWIGMQIRTRAR